MFRSDVACLLESAIVAIITVVISPSKECLRIIRFGFQKAEDHERGEPPHTHKSLIIFWLLVAIQMFAAQFW